MSNGGCLLGHARAVKDVVQIAAGDYYNLALKRNGTVEAWGADDQVSGQLAGVISITAGSAHNLALQADGTVIAWGANDNRQCDIPAV